MGGMNDRKGHLSMHNRPTYNDNYPKFLYTLSLCWKAEEEKRLRYVIDNLWFNPQEDKSIKAVNTAKCLTDYLLLFKDIYEYIYHISQSGDNGNERVTVQFAFKVDGI